MPKKPETKTVQCAHSIEGPSIARFVVAWRDRCKNKIRVPVDTAEYGVYCHLHKR